jgi:2-polyprenyl-3-methyl-5-hydroxy-6-metoxy-1,4-benzoquinol methylase
VDGSGREQRWKEQAEFFDVEAAEAAAGSNRPLTERTMRRYRDLRRRRFIPEYRFRVAGRLEGKRVIDVGCGTGENSVLLAKLGARVTGIDVSAGAIRIAEQRAEVNGVGDRAEFLCTPVEQAPVPARSFDMIWCDAFLHHVLDELPGVLSQFRDWCVPGGEAVITEPVSLSRTLRAVRLALLPPPVATPTERPLNRREIETIGHAFDEPKIRFFGFLGRLDKLILENDNFEESSRVRRTMSSVLHLADWPLLSVPQVQRLASQVVISGTIRTERLARRRAR